MTAADVIVVSSPLLRPLRFLALELAVTAAFVLTLWHALAARRRGDGWPLFQWCAAACYGVAIELVALTFFNNYDHARFTVQLYRGKLPLYVVLLYPAFHYTGLKMAERWRLRWWSEALLCGLFIAVLDVPFDIAGPAAGWWRWSTHDPNLAVRWLGVPLTSYYWYLLFGAIYAALLRATARLVRRRGRQLSASWMAAAPLVGVAVVVGGIAAFIPFHLLKALGIPDAAIVGGHALACVALAWRLRPVGAAPLDGRLRAATLLLQVVPLAVLVAVERSPAKLLVAALALIALARWSGQTIVQESAVSKIRTT